MNYHLTEEGIKFWNSGCFVKPTDRICRELLICHFISVFKNAYLNADTNDMTENYYLQYSKDTQHLINSTKPSVNFINHLLINDRKPLEICIAVCNAKYLKKYDLLIYANDKGEECIASKRKKVNA